MALKFVHLLLFQYGSSLHPTRLESDELRTLTGQSTLYFIWLVDGDMSHIGICSDMRVVSWCLRISHFSQLSFMQCMGLCVFSFPIYLTMIVRIRVIYLIFTIKSEVWPICHCLGSGHETLVCAVCLSIFFELFFIFSSLSIFSYNPHPCC